MVMCMELCFLWDVWFLLRHATTKQPIIMCLFTSFHFSLADPPEQSLNTDKAGLWLPKCFQLMIPVNTLRNMTWLNKWEWTLDFQIIFTCWINVLSSSILVWFHFLGPVAWGRISSTGKGEDREKQKWERRINKEVFIIEIFFNMKIYIISKKLPINFTTNI